MKDRILSALGFLMALAIALICCLAFVPVGGEPW